MNNDISAEVAEAKHFLGIAARCSGEGFTTEATADATIGVGYAILALVKLLDVIVVPTLEPGGGCGRVLVETLGGE